jgi:hypothetical protein
MPRDMSDLTDPFRPMPEDMGHDTTGRTCWCQPKVEQLCPACLGELPLRIHCDRCLGEGYVAQFTDDPEWPTLTIHKDFPFSHLN